MGLNKNSMGDREVYSFTSENGDILLSYSELRDRAEFDDHSRLLKKVERLMDSGDCAPEIEEFCTLIEEAMNEYSENNFDNIRDLMGSFIGKTIMDITQSDQEEWEEGDDPYVMIMFDDGSTMKLYMHAFECFDAITNIENALRLAYDEDEDEDDLEDEY